MLNYGEMFLPSGEQFKWNSHSLSAWETCPQYYKYTIIDGWQKPGGNMHFTFGGIYAAAHQRYYLSRAEKKSREESILDAVQLAMEQSWERYDCPSCHNGMTDDGETCIHPGCTAGKVSRPWDSHDPKNLKTRFNLIRTLVWYFEDFPVDLPVLTFNGAPAVELSFTLDVDGGNMLVGTLDRVVEYNGSQFVMDQKTTSTTISPRYFDQWKPNTQMSAYTFAGRAVFQEPIRGVIIDAVQIAVGFSRFARGLTMRTESELEEWYDTAMWNIEGAQRAVREQRFPQRATSCDRFGGCPFRPICSRAPEVRGNFLRSDFEKAK